MNKKHIYIFCFLIISFFIQANNITKAYKALRIYNYFEAKRLFEKTFRKQKSYSAYGLAVIYARTDNPFSQVDSAAKYITVCHLAFKDTALYHGFRINKNSIDSLAHQILLRGFNSYKEKNSVKGYNEYLSHYYFNNSSIKKNAIYLRDSLDFNYYKLFQRSDSIKNFIVKYPDTELLSQASSLYDDLEFQEQCPNKKIEELKRFIKRFPSNAHLPEAEKLLYNQTLALHQTDSLHQFIKKYSTQLTYESAWKSLYSLSVGNYNKEELVQFSTTYPDYPFSYFLEKEINLSQEILLPIENQHNKIGFIDTLGHWRINAQYDDANFFSEGFSAVCKHDSCFYITKDGERLSPAIFEEAEDYKFGVAIIQKNNLFYLINRSAQIISKGYVLINKQSDELFVCKQSTYYGAINYKGEIIIPFQYEKLGDFKKGFAYYQSNKYGLISKNNNTLNAEWDWISDVDTNNIVLIKKDNQFGLMHSNGNVILKPEYDYIETAKNGIYLLVKNGLYGFYNSEQRCFVTNIDFDYDKSYKADDYTTGTYFKLFKNKEVALIDVNGRYSINFGLYTNLFFAKCDMIRIQKNNKYGFVDRKLKPVITAEYDKAIDFDNSVTLVSKANKDYLLNKEGKIVFFEKEAMLEKLNSNLYLIKGNELLGIIDSKGTRLLNSEFESIKLITKHFYHCVKPDGQDFLWNALNHTLIKL